MPCTPGVPPIATDSTCGVGPASRITACILINVSGDLLGGYTAGYTCIVRDMVL